MSITVKRYTHDLEQQYEVLLRESPIAMFNHSLRYREFLKSILSNCEDYYLCALQGDELVAVLPLFVKQGYYGAVVNSLPFFGSHGGLVYKKSISEEKINDAIFQELNKLCIDLGAFSCTLIESPLEKNRYYYDYFGTTLFDERIGQITPLISGSDKSDVEEKLLILYHQKTRNMVRKGKKAGFDVAHDGSEQTIRTLHSLHEANILGIGGIAKPLSVFLAIRENFEYGKHYRIYIAKKDNKIISALLLFYFKDTVEYFTPATHEAYRSDQPLSLLIFTAMRDAILEKQARFWNWGGTWLSQMGVYQFKARWGTIDYPYRYHIKVFTDKSKKHPMKDDLLSMYQYFYTIPFSELDKHELP